VDDAAGTVAIRDLGRREKLYADEKGLTVRARGYGTRRFAWRKVSGFADGGTWKQGEYVWQLDIVLRKGEREPVHCTAGGCTPELLATVRQVAASHGLSADLEGIAPPAPPPEEPGFFEDPFGQGGMRYWNGSQWSPPLPAELRKSRSTLSKSAASWSALPTVQGRWTHAASQARYATANAAFVGVFSASLLVWTLLTQAGLIGPPGGEPMTPDEWLTVDGVALAYALVARGMWRKRRFWRRLDEAANRAPAVREGYP